MVQFDYFQNTQTLASDGAPAHTLFLLAMSDHLIAALFHQAATNGLSRLLTTVVVNNFRLMFFKIPDQFEKLFFVFRVNRRF